MKYLKLFSILFLALSILSCDKEEVHKKGEFEIISQSDLKFDLIFPQELWDEIMRKAPVTLNINKSAYELFESLNMQVELVDGSKEVLSGKNYRFDFKDFGGDIDYNTYINRDAVGNFKMYFNFPELPADGEMRVYFLSWSKQHTDDDEVFGNGCGYFYDVTNYFTKEVLNKGLLLHSNGYRYLDVTAGRLYFVNYIKDKIQLAQITLTDSSLDNRLCSDRL